MCLKDKPPDLVLSGVNWGSNLADDVTYSGTIAGAMERLRPGHSRPSPCRRRRDEDIRDDIDWSPGEVHGPGLIRRLLAVGLAPRALLLNMNFPGLQRRRSERRRGGAAGRI